ncbi:phosphoesterase [Haloferax sp. MBLA0076]|uniref:Phosphoesterase n=1 Tax=Haloferax litoreum TaxID=2666140 RepID=A0A6A8GK49_9EURY|nr:MULTISPECIES: metallophosphoesterase [Haloferax]KAB1190576.1 phosphoesterase [Haloferax sp. CBA1148]MRX23563.1 phosphoesterase [Haloferax litoreum]
MSQHTTGRDEPRYYFISDLHIGGDEQLQNVEFKDELLAFLRTLEAADENAELIVNGDAFGLWEFTELEGLEKFDALVDRYPDLFEQFRATGAQIPITFIPGNHDYELACYAEYVDRLAEYNITLEQEVVITRPVGGRTIWVEHGQQRDPNNKSPDFGNPYANPPGYFVNRHITSRAGKLSGRGKFNWLKDIQSVTPMTQIPEWMISKYFYREMSPFLRYASLPFLLLFNVSVLYLVAFLLSLFGIWSEPLSIVDSFIRFIGFAGVLIDIVLVVNIVVIVILLLLSVPLFFVVRDIRKTLQRFGLVEEADPQDVSDAYIEGAREVFEENPDVAVFVYGHTHRASLNEVDDRAVVNTGTWLKRLHRKSVLLGILPLVFYSSFRLNYFVISPADGAVAIEYHRIEKEDPRDLTLLEKLLTRKPKIEDSIPKRTLVGTEWESGAELETQPTHQMSADGRRPTGETTPDE